MYHMSQINILNICSLSFTSLFSLIPILITILLHLHNYPFLESVLYLYSFIIEVNDSRLENLLDHNYQRQSGSNCFVCIKKLLALLYAI